MQTRPFAALEAACPVIGFGAWGIGGETPGGTSYGPYSDEAASACIDAAYAGGMRFFDTAPAYGNSESERRLGRALRGRRQDVILATKGGLYDFAEGADFSAARLERGLDDSLERLGTDYVDLFQLHNPPGDLLTGNAELVRWLDDIRASGKVRALGISVKAPDEAFALLKAYPFTAIQANFNMLDLRALESGLLDHCANQDIAFFARTPLCFGFLTLTIDENTVFDAADHRAHWPKDQLRLWVDGANSAQRIAESHDPAGTSATSRALRFCLTHPGVTCVLCGPMSADEAAENAAAGAENPLSEVCLDEIAALNRAQSFFLPR